MPSASLTVQSLESLQRSIADVTEAVQQGFRIRRRSGNTISTVSQISDATCNDIPVVADETAKKTSCNDIPDVADEAAKKISCNDIPVVADEAAKETIVRFSEDTKNEFNETYSRGGGTARETFADVALNLGGYIGESASLNEDSNENGSAISSQAQAAAASSDSASGQYSADSFEATSSAASGFTDRS